MLAQELARIPRAVGIYCRLSYAPDGLLEKVEQQEGDCRELGARLRWPISEQHVFVDNSKSAWRRDRRRPDWDRLLLAVEAGEIDGLLVYHGDRLIRQPYDLEKLITLAELHPGFQIASPSGTRNLNSPDDRFILRIEAAQACREVDNTSRRVRGTNLALVKQGRRVGGGRYRPFGFGVDTGRTRVRVNRRTRVEEEVPVIDVERVREDEAALIEESADRLLSGQTQYGVVKWLRSRCRTTAGNEWSGEAFKAMMLSPRIAGLIEHGGQLYKARWEPIISPETRENLRALYRSKAREMPYAGRDRKHMLSGVAVCGSGCGERVQKKAPGTGSGRRRVPPGPQYFCPGCGMSRDMAYVDAWVSGRTVELLNHPEFLKSFFSSAGADEVGKSITQLERRRRVLAEEIEAAADDPDVDVALGLRSLAGFDRRLRELRERLVVDSRQRMLVRLAGISQKGWEAEPVDVRSSAVQALWRVVILPVVRLGPGFDPSRVLMVRRGALLLREEAAAVAGVPGGRLTSLGRWRGFPQAREKKVRGGPGPTVGWELDEVLAWVRQRRREQREAERVAEERVAEERGAAGVVRVPDEVWGRVEALMPARNVSGGGRWRDHRLMLEAIAWKFDTGLPWRQLPERFGSQGGVYTRMRRWALDGTWEKLASALGDVRWVQTASRYAASLREWEAERGASAR